MAQYLNEIVSITIMLMLAIALIAGQAGAGVSGADDGSEPLAYQAVRAAGDR